MRIIRSMRASLLAVLIFLCAFPFSAFSDTEPTATPEPLVIRRTVAEPPEVIRTMIDVARTEWEQLDGKKLSKSNKYTQVFNEYEWGWCASFTSWCAMKADVPRASLNAIRKLPEGEADPVFTCFTTSPGKYLSAFQHMHRTTMIPQKGYWILYGDRTNYCVHIGLVCDVELLENGKYRLTTIEGNMKNSVIMYLADYEPVDVYYEQHHRPSVSNLTVIPEEERNLAEQKNLFYRLRISDSDGSDWYVTCFLMTWIPEDDFYVVDEEVSP